MLPIKKDSDSSKEVQLKRVDLDSVFIERYLQGNLQAFDTLYERHTSVLYNFLLQLNVSQDEAEDLVQETWIRAIRNLKGYRGETKFRQWLIRIAHNLLRDLRKSAWERRKQSMTVNENNEEVTVIEYFSDPAENPRQLAITRELDLSIEAAIEKLPIKLKETMLLRIDGELTYREIAEQMNCPLGTVLWRAREGQKKLAELLQTRMEEVS